jgi:hypothetical protein
VGQDRENLAPLWPNSHRAQSHNKASSGQPIKKLPWKYIDKTPLRDILSSSTTLGSIESCFMGKKEQKSGTAFWRQIKTSKLVPTWTFLLYKTLN